MTGKRTLIADSGSTKTDWCCLECGSGRQLRFTSQGYNPNYMTRAEIAADMLRCLPSDLDTDSIDEVYFYGAGVTPMQYPFIESILRSVFPALDGVSVAMDTLAAARALLGRKPGLAVILGTGMNSCLYDGEEEVLNIDSCGFIMGDEGSGGYIGKTLLRDFIRGDMPAYAGKIVAAKVRMSPEEIIDTIYTKPFPNRFCAQYSRFVKMHLGSGPYFRELVESSFRDLFRNVISRYPNYRDYSFNCVGSVGYGFKDILEGVVSEYGMKVGRIVRTPMPGLVEYHTVAPVRSGL